MRSGILIILFVALFPLVTAQPVITGVSFSDFSQNAAVSVSGNNFGTKDLNFNYFDDFEDRVVEAPLDNDWDIGLSTNEFTRYSNNYPRGHSQMSIRHEMSYNEHNGRLIKQVFNSPGKKFVSFWSRIDMVDLRASGIWQIKHARLESGPNHGDEPALMYATTWSASGSPDWQYFITNGITNDNNKNVKVIDNQWIRMDFIIEDNSQVGVLDGAVGWNFFYPEFPPDPGNPQREYQFDNTASTKTSTVQNPLTHLKLGYYLTQNMAPGHEVHTYWDDIYVDDSWARIEVCNNINFLEANHCELQIPNGWQNNQITFNLRLGGFTQQDINNGLYLFVVDENGVASQAYQITTQPICEATFGNCYYISPDGSDSNDGSFLNPWASTNPIYQNLQPGDYLYWRGGNYGPAAKGPAQRYNGYSIITLFDTHGTADNPIHLKAYPGEKPVFDVFAINPEFDRYAYGDCGPTAGYCYATNPDRAFTISGSSHIVVDGLEITGSGIDISSSQNMIIRNNHVHHMWTDQDNPGLIKVYTVSAHIYNNTLHDIYSRSVKINNIWQFNIDNLHDDAQHNGCLTTMSGDGYGGYGSSSNGPLLIENNTFRDCPSHFFIKNPQGHLVDENGWNMVIRNNYFSGDGYFSHSFNGANVLVENNLVDLPRGFHHIGYWVTDPLVNSILGRNVNLKNNVFTRVSTFVGTLEHGYLPENGPYSTAYEDKLKLYDNIIVIVNPSTPGNMGWNQGGVLFGGGKDIDVTAPPSGVLSRIDSMNNCIISSAGDNLAVFKQWTDNGDSYFIRGISIQDAINGYNYNGAGDLYPTQTDLNTHFADIASNDYSLLPSSPCYNIPNVGLTNPEIFNGANPVCNNGIKEIGEDCDQNDLNGQSCSSLPGFISGTLSCNNDCTFNTNSCVADLCGNGIIDEGEVCDTNNFGSATCSDYGLTYGELECSTNCQQIITNACANVFEIIIDDGDPLTSSTGSWYSGSTHSGYYGSGYEYSSTSAGNTYTWQTDLASGVYEIGFSWSTHSGRPDDNTLNIYVDGVLVDSQINNQQISDGGFYPLGTYSVTNNARVELIGSNSTEGASADAVRFYRIGDISNEPTYDLNTDGFINIEDLEILVNNFGNSYSIGDYDNDGIITIKDLVTHIKNWN